jgi:hypothetical protein
LLPQKRVKTSTISYSTKALILMTKGILIRKAPGDAVADFGQSITLPDYGGWPEELKTLLNANTRQIRYSIPQVMNAALFVSLFEIFIISYSFTFFAGI